MSRPSKKHSKANLLSRLKSAFNNLVFLSRKRKKKNRVSKTEVIRESSDGPQSLIVAAIQSIYEAKSNGDYDRECTFAEIELGANLSIQTQNRGVALVLVYITDRADIPGMEDKLGEILMACKPICVKFNCRYSYVVITLGMGTFVTLIALWLTSTDIGQELKTSIINLLRNIFR
jgi:hypothetical protein